MACFVGWGGIAQQPYQPGTGDVRDVIREHDERAAYRTRLGAVSLGQGRCPVRNPFVVTGDTGTGGSPSPEAITALLAEASAGDPAAHAQLWRSIYPDLHAIAHRALLRRRPGHTLQTTALVNEAYLKLVHHQQADWDGRLHFFAVAARAMRHILIDYARQRGRQKRGGGQAPVSLDEAVAVAEERADTLLALDEALTALAERDERLGRIVEYRFFGGMTEAEVARLLGVTDRTVRREWRKAKAWLAAALAEPPSPP